MGHGGRIEVTSKLAAPCACGGEIHIGGLWNARDQYGGIVFQCMSCRKRWGEANPPPGATDERGWVCKPLPRCYITRGKDNMDASARDWMGTEIEIGQTVAYCGADVFGWPQAIVQDVSDEGVSLAFKNGVRRTVRPEQVVVLDKET